MMNDIWIALATVVYKISVMFLKIVSLHSCLSLLVVCTDKNFTLHMTTFSDSVQICDSNNTYIQLLQWRWILISQHLS